MGIKIAVDQNVETHAALTEAQANGRPWASCTVCAHGEGPAGGACRRCISMTIEDHDERDEALAALPPRTFD